MVISFFTIAAAAQKEWFEERFSALYLDETLAGRREVTVVFADLAGFTPFSEANGPEAVHQMLIAYFGELAPMIVDDFEGEVQDFVGDQIFAIFNKRGDQPDHALRGAKAALELQRRAATHPPTRLAALPLRRQHRPDRRRRRRRPRPPHPRRLRRHGQPRLAPGGPGAARRDRDRPGDPRRRSRRTPTCAS